METSQVQEATDKGTQPNPHLTNCPACNREVSKDAQTCPNCGHRLKAVELGFKIPKPFRWGTAIGGGLIILIVASFSGGFLGTAASSSAIGTLFILAAGGLGGWWAGKGKLKAWPRVWLVTTILSFFVPIAAALAAPAIAKQASAGGSAAEQSGAALGAGLGVALLTGLFLFVGLILLIVTIFTWRGASHKEERARDAGITL
jgi:uncharacterized membrane protein